jgi:predicted transcriptional regulator
MAGSQSTYRDRIYIVKDLILKLVEYGEMNQTSLISFCGLNLKKHKFILDDLELNGLITKREIRSSKRRITIYRPTEKGIEFPERSWNHTKECFPGGVAVMKQKKHSLMQRMKIIKEQKNHSYGFHFNRTILNDEFS